MDNITNKKTVLIDAEEPTALAYYNIYEEGDIWIKTKNCNDCPLESRKMCCGTCPMLLKDTGECRLHLGVNKDDKPYHCIISPPPNQCKSYCQLEFECVKGINKGKIRRIQDPQDVFKDR